MPVIEYVGTGKTMSWKERKKKVEDLYNDVILPNRDLLRQSRDHTLLSTGTSTRTGHLGECVASLVTGVRGRGRNGKTASGLTGDLSDNTEVKAVNTADVGIEYFLHGVLIEFANRRRIIQLTKPEEYNEMVSLSGILDQVKNTVTLVHLCNPVTNAGKITATKHISRVKGVKKPDELDDILTAKDCKELLSSAGLKKTGNKSELLERIKTERDTNADANTKQLLLQSYPNLTGAWYLELHETDGQTLPVEAVGSERLFHFRLEGSHLNFGKKTPDQMRVILNGGAVISWTYLDMRGRYSVAIFRTQMSTAQIDTYLAGRGAEQPQPRLFHEHIRKVNKTSNTLADLGAKLLMLGRTNASGKFKIEEWRTEGDQKPLRLTNDVIKKIEGDWDTNLPNLSWAKTTVEWKNKTKRMKAAIDFWDKAVCKYFRDFKPYCDLTGTSLHIKFDLLLEHLTSYVSGLKGNRSGARGHDLYAPDGNAVEVKAAIGWKGDAFGTEDQPRWDLGVVKAKKSLQRARMMRWQRLYLLRMLLEDIENKLQLSIAIHKEEGNENNMKSLHKIIEQYGMKTQLNVNAKNSLFESEYKLGLNRKGDNRRKHELQEVVRFIEGRKTVILCASYRTGTNPPTKCNCEHCSKRWVAEKLG